MVCPQKYLSHIKAGQKAEKSSQEEELAQTASCCG